MPVKIHGNDYVTVGERINQIHKEDALRSVECRILSPLDSTNVIVQAIITTTKGTFTGMAESIRGSEGITGESPFEVAETSAVGRALAFAGYAGSMSIASADEVKAKSKPIPTRAVEVPGMGADDIAKEFGGKAVDVCHGCGVSIVDTGGFKAKDIVAFSKRKFGKAYCIACQKTAGKG